MFRNTLLVCFLGVVMALVCAATPLPASGASEPRTWPEREISGLRKLKRGLNNAERLQRGLAPLTPARLYDPSRVHSAPKARLSGGGTVPNADTVGDDYTFYECFPADTGATAYYGISATSDQDAVNQCAGYTHSASKYGFSLAYTGGSGYSCGVSASGSGTSEICTQGNYAIYREPI